MMQNPSSRTRIELFDIVHVDSVNQNTLNKGLPCIVHVNFKKPSVVVVNS